MAMSLGCCCPPSFLAGESPLPKPSSTLCLVSPPANLSMGRLVTGAVSSKAAATTRKRELRGITNPRSISPAMQELLVVPEIPRTQALKQFNLQIVASANPEPLRIMISGAPASGKGTQCELITKKYGLVHIAAGDLLRAEVAVGSENGKRAKEYMEKGQLVPNEIVVMMVKERLWQPDSQENGWLLDGYPRSSSQATALEELGIRPDLFILLDVPEEILVERVVGRRLDPVTGRIYHLKYSPPESEEIAARLTQRFDDTEEKVKLRLQTHHQNVEAVLSIYEDITIKVNGSASKEDVFAQIDSALTGLVEQKKATSTSLA